MRNVLKGVSFLSLSLLLLLTACSGGGNSGASQNTNGEPSNSGTVADDGSGIKPVTFSFYGNYDWLTTAPWAENEATRWIQENRKVTVEPVQSGEPPPKSLTL